MPVTPAGDALLSQLIKFPGGRWDDGADMCGLIGRYINKVWKATKPQLEKGRFSVSTKKKTPAPRLKVADLMDFDDD